MSRKTRVLLVDDDQLLKRLVSQQLTAMGFEVTTGASGIEALKALGGSDFDVGAPHGPGGGRGFVALSAAATTNVGGAHGLTSGSDPTYNSTDGSTGQTLTIAAISIPGAGAGTQCVPVLAVTKTTSTPTLNNTGTGVAATYTIVVTNAANCSAAGDVALSDTLPASFTYTSTGTITLSGGATRPTTTNPTANATVPSWSVFIIPGGASVSLTFTVQIAAGVPGTQQNPAAATYLDPTRTTAGGMTSASYNSASSTGEGVTVTAPPVVALDKSVTPNGTQPPAPTSGLLPFYAKVCLHTWQTKTAGD